jgi:hypothetical protein
MAISSDQLESKLDALEEAIYSGVLEIEYEGRKQRYRSLKDMQAARRMILKSLGRLKTNHRETIATSKNL